MLLEGVKLTSKTEDPTFTLVDPVPLLLEGVIGSEFATVVMGEGGVDIVADGVQLVANVIGGGKLISSSREAKISA